MRRIAIPAKKSVVLCALLLSISCTSSVTRYIEKGDKADSSNNFEEAAINYRKAIQKDAGSGDAYYKLGLTELKRGRVGEALALLQKAADLSPDNPEPLTKVGELLFAGYLGAPKHRDELYVKIDKIADRLLKINPNSEEGLKLKGSLALSDGPAAQAVDLLRKASVANPSSPALAQLLSSALIKSGQTAEGLGLARQTLDNHKDFSPIYGFLVRYYLHANQAQEAESIAKLKIANNPAVSQYVIELATYYAQGNKKAEMQAELQILLDNPAKYPSGRLEVGAFYSAMKNLDESLRTYQEGLRTDPARKVDYQKRIAGVLNAQGKRDDALKLLSEILRQSPKDFDVRLLRSKMLLETGKPDDAAAAITELTALSKERPDNASASYQLGITDAAHGDLVNAREQFNKATLDPSTYVDAHLALAQLDEATHRWKSMLQHADYALLLNPADPGARLARAIALGREREYSKAQFELNALVKDLPQFKKARFALARTDIALGHPEKAEAEFTAELKAAPSDYGALEGLTESYMAQKKFAAAVQMLTGKLSEPSASPALHSLLANVAMRSGDYELASAQYQELIAANSAGIELYLGLGAALHEKGDDDGAVAALRKAVTLDAKNIAAASMLATVTGRAEDVDRAVALCRETLKAEPTDAETENNLAFLLAQRGADLDESVSMARHAVETMPWETGFVDTLGFALAKKGLADESVNVLGRLVFDHPDNAAFHYHLALALVSKGDRPKSLSELHAALQARPSRNEKREIQELLEKVN